MGAALIHIIEVYYDLARLIVELTPNLLMIVIYRRLVCHAGGGWACLG